MIYAYPYSLGSRKSNPSISYSGPYLYWYILSVLKTSTYSLAVVFWTLTAIIKNARGDSINYIFLVLMKVCALQPLLFNILLSFVIYLRYDSYNYIRSLDPNFWTLFILLQVDTAAGWYVYLATFSDLLMNYQYFSFYK